MKKSLPVLKEVAEDVFLAAIPVPLMGQVNCYLFRGENGFTVIDTGLYTKEGRDLWEDLLSSGIQIEKVVLTHFHIDHIGFAKWFQEKYQVPIYISSTGYEEMKKRRTGTYSDWVLNLFQQHDGLQVFRTAIEEQIEVEKQMLHVYEFEPDGLLEDGQYIILGNESYEAIWTPGHSPDHYCFYNREREMMILGDHIMKKISPVILIESSTDVNPLMNYFASLEKIKEYSIKLALPGHGELMDNPNLRLEEIKCGHQYRMEQIIESLKEGEKTAGQLSQEIYGLMNSKLAFSPVMSTITRCIYLESIGKLKSQWNQGKIFYQLAKS